MVYGTLRFHAAFIHKGSPIIPILSRINPITRIDTYLFKVHSTVKIIFIQKRHTGPRNWMTTDYPKNFINLKGKEI